MERRRYLRFTSFFYAFLCVSLCACEYELEGEHFKKVNPAPPSGISLVFEQEADTLQLRGTVTLNFSTRQPEQEVLAYELLVNEQPYTSGRGFPYEIDFNSTHFANTLCRLRLIVHYRANTNSLADQLGAETLPREFSWPMYIDNTKIDTYSLEQVKLVKEKGQLRVQWPAYKQLNFSRYVLIKKIKDAEDGAAAYKTYEFKDHNRLSWLDESYVGKPTTYEFHLFDTEGNARIKLLETKEAAPALIKSVSHTNGKNVKVVWHRCTYEKNFSAYKLFKYSSYIGSSNFESEQIADTSHTTDKLSFGFPNTFRLEVVSKNKDGLPNNLISEKEVMWGVEAPFSVYSARYVPGNHSFYLLETNSGMLKRYRADDYKEAAALKLPPYVSTYAVSADGSSLYYLHENKVVVCDPLSLQLLSEISLSDLTGFNHRPRLLAAYGKKLAANYQKNSTSGNDTLYLIDMEKKKVLSREAYRFPLSKLVFSPTGRSLVVEDTYWTSVTNIDENGLESSNPIESFYAYLHDGTGRLVTYDWRDITLEIFDPADMVIQKVIPLSRPYDGFQLDPTTNLIGKILLDEADNPQEWEILSLDKQQVVQRIAVSTSEVRMVNNALSCWKNNYILPLN